MSSVSRRAVFSFAVAFLLAVAVPGDVQGTHSDGSYDIPVWFKWNKRVLDVLIIPPNRGTLTSLEEDYMAAIWDSVTQWQNAINKYSPALANAVRINLYVLGQGTTPTDPEIVITADASKGTMLGVAVRVTDGKCVVDNSRLFVTPLSYRDMYNVNGQEYGHCLGLDHVGGDHPSRDIMNGNYPYAVGGQNPFQCISNLDVRGLEKVFGLTSGTSASISASSYQGIPAGCGN